MKELLLVLLQGQIIHIKVFVRKQVFNKIFLSSLLLHVTVIEKQVT